MNHQTKNNKYLYLTLKVALIISLVTIGMIAASCGKAQQEQENDLPVPPIIYTEHNARNSLDYVGTYKGVIPSADGEGMEIELEIRADGICMLRTEHKGMDNGDFEAYAAYSWNEQGSVITLDALPPPNRYFIGENYVVRLDKDEEFVRGEHTDQHILRKVATETE